MCGISCAVTLKGHAPSSKHSNAKSRKEAESLEREYLDHAFDESLELIKHRGPDDRGYWLSEHCRVGLGHVRLSIVDLSPEAQQPFHDEEGDVHAVVSGEFYGYESIREDLIRKGYHFQSHCDSEIIIALYKEYGLRLFQHLRGEFAFCLYDSKAQFFIAARDRYGVKPLFYTVHDGKLLIASEIKAFLPFGWQPEWDVQSIFENGWCSDKRTVFQGVQKIMPGHYLTVQSFGAINQAQYWDQEYPDKHAIETRTEEEMITGVRQRLVDAVRVRLRADVPTGIFLSGGLDSSAIAGITKHLIETEGVSIGTTHSINCFSIKFLDDEFDEEPIAQRTAEWLGVKTHVVSMTEERFATDFSAAVWHAESLLPDLNFVGKFALSALTKATGVDVVLTGEGSDEQFAGYADLLTDFLREPDYSWPQRELPEDHRITRFTALDNPPEANFANLSKTFRTKEAPTSAYPRRQINNVGMVSVVQLASPNDLSAAWPVQEFGTSDARTAIVHNGINGIARENISLKWHPLHSALYLWTKMMLHNVLLVPLGDRIEMAHSVEGRQPFLDHHLAEYVNGLPPTMKIRYDPETKSFNEKWILKEAARPFITDELYKRRKHPFSAPTRYRINGPLHTFFATVVTKDAVDNLGFFAWEKCKDLVENAFVKEDPRAMRRLFLVAQFVVLGERFGVRKAEPEFAIVEEEEVQTKVQQIDQMAGLTRQVSQPRL